jgi:hypothetical protein
MQMYNSIKHLQPSYWFKKVIDFFLRLTNFTKHVEYKDDGKSKKLHFTISLLLSLSLIKSGVASPAFDQNPKYDLNNPARLTRH